MAADMLFNICTNLGESLPFLNRASKRRKIDAASRIAEYGRWHELPVELMEMILQYLGLADRVCMTAVCKSWGLVLMQNDMRVPQEFPWLLLPHSRHCKNLSLFNMSLGKIHDIKLPKLAHGCQCCGSSKGWLVMANQTKVFLLNPLTGVLHQLPSLTTIPSFNDAIMYNNLDSYKKVSLFVEKIELSSKDPSECTVAAIFGRDQVLACCRPKDKSWTIFQGIERGDGVQFMDILFCNETLYAMMTSKTYQPTMRIMKFTATTYTMKLADDDDDRIVTLKLLPHIRNFIEAKPTQVNYFDNFAIHEESEADCFLTESNESNGELLIIRQYMDKLFPSRHDDDDDDDDDEDDDNFSNHQYYRTSRFEVFKFSPADEDNNDGISGTSFCISRIESLGNNRVLFLTQGGSSFVISTTTTTADHQATGNCIYFSDNLYHYQEDHELFMSRETGVFYLDDGRIRRPFPSAQLPRQSRMCWLIPFIS